MSFEDGKELQAIVVDVSDSGMAVTLAEPLPRTRALRVSLLLPRTKGAIEGYGEVIWADHQARAGIRFVQLPQVSHKEMLKEWLSSRETKL